MLKPDNTNNGILSRLKVEGQILWRNKIVLISSVLMQYLHSIATNIAYFRHVPGASLRDIGFELIPEISTDLSIISEILFFIVFGCTAILGLLPLFYKRSRVHTSTIFIRTLFVMALCIVFRCVSFLSTSLPGPAAHCKQNNPNYNPPETVYDIIFKVDPFSGCGDLLYSSHTSLSLCLLLSFYVYSPYLISKKVSRIISYFVLCPVFLAMAILIIAARKHYTVDVVVAVYVTPMIYYISYYFVKDITDDNLKSSEKTKLPNNAKLELVDDVIKMTM